MSAPTWIDLSASLADQMPLLRSRTHLLLSWAQNASVYVHLSQTNDVLVAETGLNNAESSVGVAAGPELLRQLGWVGPAIEPHHLGTWSLELPWPARTVAYTYLADAVISTLRDVGGVPDPDALEYRAWRDPEPAPENVLFYPENLEPGEDHMTFRALGISDASMDA